MLKGTQINLYDIDHKYKEFVDKFKPKKTTDDCYTPENIYNAIADWVADRYNVKRENFVRPFWPGGDYERYQYKDTDIVVDNPPFSMLAKICRHYINNNIKFFLFSPYLTVFSGGPGCCSIVTGSKITYENGAQVDTSFKTNLDKALARSCPELGRIIKEQDDINKAKRSKQLPKYAYPNEVLTASMLGYMAIHGEEFAVYPESAYFVRELESQKRQGKAIFGAGYLLSEKAAAEKAAAVRWPLSENEKEIIKGLK